MSTFAYTIRNYRAEDFDKYVRLKVGAEKLKPAGRSLSAQAIVESLERPNYSPEQDLFVAELAGDIIGYLDVTPNLGIGRVILDCWIHPEYRRRGLAGKLCHGAMRRARELGVRVAHVNVTEDNIVAGSLLPRLGFKYVRRFLELSLDLGRVRGQDIDQVARGCRRLQSGEEDKLAQLQNRAFADTWGYNPNTVEEISYYTNLADHSAENVVLTCDSEEVIGYCWIKITDDGKAATGERAGRILMLGTDPDYRGRGVGRRVLLAGLAYLRSRGISTVGLTVDSENELACALYRSVGFRVKVSSLWFEKPVNQGDETK